MQAAVEESKILLKRKEISDLVKQDEVDAELKQKLQLVLDARSFGESIGLTPKGSFTKFSKVDKDVLVWVLAGSKQTSFDVYTWWFPIVGHVPYKGYFSKTDAERAAWKLSWRGYETFIRGAEALSTLGWFDDPILSTTLKNEDSWIVNTVLHESLHSTVWIPNHVTFNESLANFFGFQGTIDFYRSQNDQVKIKQSKESLRREFELGRAVEKLYADLDKLYKSEISEDEKLRRREIIFAKSLSPIKAKYPKLKILKTINNSEILQLKFYLTSLELFQRLYIKNNGDYAKFLSAIETLREKLKAESESDPFKLLEELIDN